MTSLATTTQATIAAPTSPMFTILTKPGCPWCDDAKKILSDHGLSFKEVSCPGTLAAELESRGHRVKATTYPVVLRGTDYVGTHDQLKDLLTEPLLKPNGSRRFTPFPIQHNDMWQMYLKAVASFWTADEVSMADDLADWVKLDEDERHFIKHVLAFFAGSDGIVMENLNANFGVEVQVPEARQFYAYQSFNESIHSQSYGLMIESLVQSSTERDKLFNAIETIPAVAKKAAWATKWLDPTRRFAERLVAFACVEGILFSGSFCAIFWLKQRGLMPGLGLFNQFISRDEGLHQDFAAMLYSDHLVHKLTHSQIETIVREAVDNEKEFIIDAIPCKLIGMNSDLMGEYIEYVADRLVVSLGHEAVYGAKNPFKWMELISLSGRTNFFEKVPSEYQKAGVMAKAEDQIFAIDADF
jgi:ribonucleotide reductase beta subunit family protein with ferritin-like domain